ncbi:MAG TPA: TIGR02587 family membrane protein [Sphingomonas sp.]|nr:TIGR02587 family membrane protein [Sphingomonas sp.]
MISQAAKLNRDYAIGLARASGGAIIFGLPLLMTMEMWAIGLHIAPARLILFMVFNLVVLVILSRFGGFERTATLIEDVLDALAAQAVGILTAIAILSLFGVIRPGGSMAELVGQVAIQSVPGSFGAMLARKQLGAGDVDDDESLAQRSAGYAGQLFLMLAGALFFAFNVAPTEEMLLIGYKMSAWHALVLAGLSLGLLHALVFAVGLAGQEAAPKGYGSARLFLAFTVPGYAIALLVSLYVLWTFGSVDGLGVPTLARIVVVLGFPAAVGAAIARLVI